MISIHAPHTGRDALSWLMVVSRETFQSTRPIRGATCYSYGFPACGSYFNPRAPYGARRNKYEIGYAWNLFQSTRPIRGATRFGSLYQVVFSISIHAPHTGRDTAKDTDSTADKQFQSTRPIRGATIPPYAAKAAKNFNPRAPYGARLWRGPLRQHRTQFQSTRPIRGATSRLILCFAIQYISIHAPHTGRD